MPKKRRPKTILLVASGDLRLSANVICWPAQLAMEKALGRAVAPPRLPDGPGPSLQAGGEARLHRLAEGGHRGLLPGSTPRAPIIVAEAVWQYSHHVLPGLVTHRGPVLTVANWSGRWPGLVGMLNLNGSLTKAGVAYSTLWSEDFTGRLLRRRPRPRGCRTGAVRHPDDPREAARAGGGSRAGRAPSPRRSPPTCGAQVDHGRLRRGLHGNVQRHHSRRAALPLRGLQGAAVPVRALPCGRRRSATGEARAVYDWLRAQGHEIPPRDAARRPSSRPARCSCSARPTSRRRGSPTSSAARRSASNTSRG